MRLRRGAILLAVFCFAGLWPGCMPEAPAQREAKVKLFEFHSGFWINLHHFLYREAELSEPRNGAHNVSVTEADTEELKHLSAQDRATWDEALSYYGQSVVKRDLLFDNELIQIKDQLEDAENSANLADARIPTELKMILLKAAPVYREHWWTRHDQDNREWINRLAPLVARYGSTLSRQMGRIYDEPWTQAPVRIDTVAYANWAGAYTTIEPTRPTISTADPSNQGVAALEIVFHETSHSMMGKVMDAMQAAEKTVNAHRAAAAFHSGTMWHAVLFYTAGELVAEQIPGYTPYADKNGLWVRAWPSPDRALIEQDWRPHMKGSAGLEQSLTKLVSDLAASTSARPM